MPAGSASRDIDFLCGLELGVGDLHFVEEDVASFLRNSSQGGVTHRSRLLVDFLEHEVLEAALFRHDRVPGDVLDLADDRLSVEVGELDAFRRNHGEVAIAQEEQVAGVIENRGHIGGYEIFVLTQSNHSRRAIACSHDFVGLIHGNHGHREYASQLTDGFANALFQRRTMTVGGLQEIFLDQVGNDFGVGLGRELVALFDQLSLQRNIVLDNAVVNDDDSSRAIAMRVSVFFGGTAVRRPASMANPVGAIERLKADDLFQVAQLALSPANLQTIAISADCDSG